MSALADVTPIRCGSTRASRPRPACCRDRRAWTDLVVAPAGSGKTTTLVARVAWLVDGGADPGTVTVVAFNKRAAEELTERLDAALAPLGVVAGAVRVRTFHALGREILMDAGVAVEPLIDRDELLRTLLPGSSAAKRARLDIAFSRFKLDLRVTADDVARDPAPGPVAGAFIAYEAAIATPVGSTSTTSSSALSHASPPTRCSSLAGARGTATLLVDEAQDVDRCNSSWPCSWRHRRTGSSWSATTTSRSMAGGWPTCDGSSGSRRSCPACGGSISRSNYRCPRLVVERAVRLVEHNDERFAKVIRAGPAAAGRLVLAPDASDETVAPRACRAWLAGRRVDAGDPCTDQSRVAARGRRRSSARPAVPAPRIELLVE